LKSALEMDTKKQTHTPFRWILPLAQLAICAALLWPLRGFLLFELQGRTREAPTKAQEPVPDIHLPPAGQPQPQPAMSLIELRVQIPALLNFPCFLLGLARGSMVPAGMFAEFWRAITWPFVGAVFWWIAGRAIEALVAARRRVVSPKIVWAEVLVATLVILLGSMLCIGFALDPSMREELIYPWRLTAAAAGLWILLGAATIAAVLAQRRIGRRPGPEPS
jgi:hypothetical protein